MASEAQSSSTVLSLSRDWVGLCTETMVSMVHEKTAEQQWHILLWGRGLFNTKWLKTHTANNISGAVFYGRDLLTSVSFVCVFTCFGFCRGNGRGTS